MADFLPAVAKTLQYEGGLVSNPGDPGGLTNFGISLKSHPELSQADIQHMPRSRAIGIYHEQYWPPAYSEIQDQGVASTLFDFGVTSGVVTAVKILQAVLFSPHLVELGDFAFLHSNLPGVAEDGCFGANTLYVLNKANARAIRVDYCAARLKYYASLGRPEFLHAWFVRSIDVLLGIEV
jgi:lysozyme family protein